MNQEFARALLFSVAADYFIISKTLGYCDNKNLNCSSSLLNIYKPLLAGAGVKFQVWEEPLSGRQNLCGITNNDKNADEFFEQLEDVFMSINIGIRKELKIPMPQIYSNGKNLDTGTCNLYLKNIENFTDNLQAGRLSIPISIDGGKVKYLSISLNGETSIPE